jgi:hypothetical protein
MFVTFSFIKVHSRIVIFTLLVRRMKLTMMHAGETEWLARISVCLLLYAHIEYKRAPLCLVSCSEVLITGATQIAMSAFRKWNKIQGKKSWHLLLIRYTKIVK